MIQNRIARRSARIAKWGKESDGVEASWTGGVEYKSFCQRMAADAREQRQHLEAELSRLQAALTSSPV